MWLLNKIRHGVERLPQELAHFVGEAEGDVCPPSKATLSNNLNNNVLTPDKIPEFCLPPKLFRRESPTLTPEGGPEHCFPSGARTQKNQASPDTEHVKDAVTGACPGGAAAAKTLRKKPPPFSAEGYGLAGVHESPNTRRKESLFHGKCPGHVFDRSHQCATRAAKRAQQVQKKTLSLPGLPPLFLGKSLSETGSTESEASSSSSDSTPMGSPYSSLRVWAELAGDPVGASASSSPRRPVQTGERGRRPTGEPSARARRRPAAAAASPPGARPLTLVPPAILPSDPLRRQEPPQREHALPLPCGGKVRLSAERAVSAPPSPTSAPSRRFTARIRVVSVEGLARDDADQRPVSCSLSLCLVPGKLQLQKSATIRNCSNPVFNEDFFFTDLSEESLAELELRLKVMDRSASGTLRRGAVRAVVTKPLCQLFPPEG